MTPIHRHGAQGPRGVGHERAGGGSGAAHVVWQGRVDAGARFGSLGCVPGL